VFQPPFEAIEVGGVLLEMHGLCDVVHGWFK
jgi:hypothetical protein